MSPFERSKNPAAPLPEDAPGDALEAWVEDYLDGRLGPAETLRFEHSLVEPEVAAAFREALVLRELLAHLPPDAAPEALISRIEGALGVTEDEARRVALRFPRIRAAFSGAGWALRGPALALATTAGGATQSFDTHASPSSLRLSMAPVVALGSRAPKEAKPSLQRRLLGRVVARLRGERR